MSEVICKAADRGFVRAIFSGRLRGHVAPLALIKGHLRCLRELAARARNEAMRARLSAWGSDYLVTDWASMPDSPSIEGHEPAFSDRRGLYRSRSNCLCTSGGRHPCGLRYFDAAGNNLDSPEFVATGATKQVGKLYGGMAQVISRNCLSLEPLPEPFTARRGWWRKWAEAIGVARSGPLGGLNLPSVSRPGFECESLDAPEFLPSGSVRWVGVDFGSTGFPSLRLVVRDYWVVSKPSWSSFSIGAASVLRSRGAAGAAARACLPRDIDELWVGSVGKNW